MTRYRLFGKDTPLTEIADLIMAENVEALSQRIKDGWDFNALLDVCAQIQELPINLALIENRLKVVEFLLARGVALNVEGHPAIVSAAPNCAPRTLELLVAHGARIDAIDRVGKNAISAALYSNRYDLLPTLVHLGLRVDADLGRSFRQAVFNRQYRAVEFFIAQGIDVNQRAPDQVFPYNPSAVAVAAKNGDMRMVELLVSHGADVTLRDAYGSRPYSLAVRNNDARMQAYLRSLEPWEWHDEERQASKLAQHRIPVGLLALLRSDDRRMELEDIGLIEFHRLVDVQEVTWQGRTFLDLLASAENYDPEGLLVWSPVDAMLAFADFEHQEFHPLCTWEEFIATPRNWWIDRL